MKNYHRSYNIQNLIFFCDMPKEEHLKISSTGGRASAESKRQKRALREKAQAAVEQYAFAEGILCDIGEFRKWKRRKDKAKRRRAQKK